MKTVTLKFFLLMVLISLGASSLMAQSRTPKKRSKKGSSRSESVQKPKIDFSSSRFAPTIGFKSLLDYVQLHPDGTFTVPQLQAYFVPTKTVGGEPVNYDPYENELLLIRGEVHPKNSNRALATFHYKIDNIRVPASTMYLKTDWELTSKVKLEAGQYNFKIKLADRTIYTFPFEVIAKNSDDPYGPVPTYYFLKGAWEEWGFMEFAEHAPQQEVTKFSFYLNDRSTDAESEVKLEERRSITYKTMLYRNGELIGAGDVSSATREIDWQAGITVRGTWNLIPTKFQEYPMPEGSEYDATLERAELKDGSYRIEVIIKDHEGSQTTQNYQFELKDNRFVLHPRTVRSQHGDPSTMIEQGPERVFIERVN